MAVAVAARIGLDVPAVRFTRHPVLVSLVPHPGLLPLAVAVWVWPRPGTWSRWLVAVPAGPSAVLGHVTVLARSDGHYGTCTPDRLARRLELARNPPGTAAKLGLRSRVQAAILAQKSGLSPP